MPNAPGPLKNFEIITEDGLTHNLFSGNIHFVFLDGTGIPPIGRLLDKSPLQHGATDRGYRIDPRPMTLHLVIDGDADASRDYIAKIFSPTDSPLILKATRDDGAVRYIDCFVNGAADFPMSSRVGQMQHVDIELVAPNPSFYNITQQTAGGTITDTANNYVIDVTGLTYEDWPIVDITGPVDAATTITIQPANLTVTLANAIAGGDTYRFDFRQGQKSVTLVSDGSNKLAEITTASLVSFADFRILPAKTAYAFGGATYATSNKIIVTPTGTTGASAAAIYWYQRWLTL